MAVNRDTWPELVQLGLWGIPSRRAAWAFVWLCLAIAVGCVAYGFVNPLFFAGGLLVFAALWYFLSILWVDKNSSWS